MKLNIKIIALILSILITSCKSNSEQSNTHTEEEGEHTEGKVVLTAQQFEALDMKIDTLPQKMLSGYVEASGTLEVPPQNEASITAIVGANITSIAVIEGDKVNKNQVVAYLSHPDIVKVQTDYLNAFNRLKFLEQNYNRQKQLYEAGVGAGVNFQKAEAEFLSAKSLLQGLEVQLNLLQINKTDLQNGKVHQKVALRSPIEGFVQKVNVNIGQYVAPQTELFNIVNTHHIHADFMVFEQDIHQVKQGQTIYFTVQSLPETEFNAKIYSVGKTFEAEPKAVHVHAEITNKTGKLIPGMYIKGKIEVDQSKTTALPTGAIASEGGKYFAFKAEQEANSWVFTPIEIVPGTKDGIFQEIKLMNTVSKGALFALNNAYYLNAELNKGEHGHDH